jgi:hypothetical protein
MAGGARPQTAEIIKTLNERCPEFTVTNNLAKADSVVTLDHEGGKGSKGCWRIEIRSLFLIATVTPICYF